MNWRLEIHDRLASTSNLCRDRAAAGEPSNLAVLARHQEQGRGSRGRTWLSIPGNLFLSVLLRPGGSLRDAGAWSLLAGVGLFDAVAEFLPAHHLTLKWPNDLLLDGRKTAGILVDATGDGALDALVIGFGVNLAGAPLIPGRPTTALAALIAPPSPEDFAQRLLAALGCCLSLQNAEGFDPIRKTWLARAQPAGTAMTLALPDRAISGRFAGLDPDGALRLQTGAETRSFRVGELHLEPAAGGAA